MLRGGKEERGVEGSVRYQGGVSKRDWDGVVGCTYPSCELPSGEGRVIWLRGLQRRSKTSRMGAVEARPFEVEWAHNNAFGNLKFCALRGLIGYKTTHLSLGVASAIDSHIGFFVRRKGEFSLPS